MSIMIIIFVSAELPCDERAGKLRQLVLLLIGIALLAASVVAGLLWTAFGPAATFGAGATFAVLAVLGVATQHAAEPA